MSGMERKYVDHPAPGIGLMVIFSLIIVFLIPATLQVLQDSARSGHPPSGVAGAAMLLITLAILCFYFWPFYTTYYTVSSSGIQVRYGPWTRQYPWSDFTTAHWQKGVFATRIGWPSVTPCVRLTDGVLLQRRAKAFGLYLTPNDPRAFLRRISEFAPDLTAETIT